ncbi:5-formyltetrahydrofolate cyclo-ligase [hydrothermal vent metagenome]|uniref:5-formyltetrahydrofolate cyclo-ligase n=1 Tax=hydrothermal vent metagenome TaxID=652676 RepID=A0A1W1B9T2_9ZZZZ
MSITKESFRKKCIKLHKKPLPNRYYLDAKVNKQLTQLLQKKAKKRAKILFYIPLDFEADIRKTLQKMRKKHTVLVPFMEGKSFKMVPYRLPLRKKKFGLYEEENSFKKFRDLDIAVVPAVGIDSKNKRVGFGKGMYDRFFAKLKRRPYTIFVQRRECRTDESVCNKYDIYADSVITAVTKL